MIRDNILAKFLGHRDFYAKSTSYFKCNNNDRYLVVPPSEETAEVLEFYKFIKRIRGFAIYKERK